MIVSLDPVPLSKMGTHLLASLGSKGRNGNSLACLRNAGSYSALTYCIPCQVAQPLGHAASTLAQSIGMDLTRSLHGCRNFYLLILPSLSFCLSFCLSLLLLILDRTDVCSPLLRLFPTQFRAKMDFSRKKRKKNTYCVVTVTPPSLQGLHA